MRKGGTTLQQWATLRAPLWRCRVPISLTPMFQRVQVRVVVYRCYNLLVPTAEGGGVDAVGVGSAPPPLRVRILGTGINDEENDASAPNAYVWMQESGARVKREAPVAAAEGGEEEGDDDGDDEEGAGAAAGGKGDVKIDMGGGDVGRPVGMADGTSEYQREFVVSAVIPGRCTLVLELMSQPLPGATALQQRDDPVGSTVVAATRIALEPRWNSRVWRELALEDRIPVEIRQVFPPAAFRRYDAADMGHVPTALQDDSDERLTLSAVGGGAVVAPRALAAGAPEDEEAAQREYLGGDDFEGLLTRSSDALGAVELWVGISRLGDPLPIPPVPEQSWAQASPTREQEGRSGR